MTYDGIGRLAGTTLGNGVTEGFGYDANRMQLTSQTATRNGGPANGLMNLTYGYDAGARQMGAGSTTGNTGQVVSISGTINSTTESAAYTYDDLERLVTSNQTSNGSNAQRRFAYDRWGNRTSMWDAVSGGSQIQSITLRQSGGAPTNQIQSVVSGSTVNYTYDATGNVTNDGAHSYAYDAESRIVSVDGGVTATYAYDQSNQRYKKTVGSTVTHYIWQGSQVIAEHGGTGASTADYVYSGSRMIARVAGLTTQYFLSDRLSERLMLNTSGNVIGRMGHLPFGEDFGESGTQEKHHFTSYERDAESDFDYGINRYYGSSVGRFLTTDPIYDVGFKAQRAVNRSRGQTTSPMMTAVANRLDKGSPNDNNLTGRQRGLEREGYSVGAQGWNRFNYTQDDPLNRVDSLGLYNWKCVWEATKCFLAIDAYIASVGGLAVACPETVGVACIAALLLHPVFAGIVVEQCGACLKACGLENKVGIIPKPGSGSGGGFGGGDLGGKGGGWGAGDPYGFGATSDFLKWLNSITPEGNPETDHLA